MTNFLKYYELVDHWRTLADSLSTNDQAGYLYKCADDLENLLGGPSNTEPPKEDDCPECQATMRALHGCLICHTCGYAKGQV